MNLLKKSLTDYTLYAKTGDILASEAGLILIMCSSY